MSDELDLVAELRAMCGGEGCVCVTCRTVDAIERLTVGEQMLNQALAERTAERDRLKELYEAGVRTWNPVYELVLAERDRLRAELAESRAMMQREAQATLARAARESP